MAKKKFKKVKKNAVKKPQHKKDVKKVRTRIKKKNPVRKGKGGKRFPTKSVKTKLVSKVGKKRKVSPKAKHSGSGGKTVRKNVAGTKQKTGINRRKVKKTFGRIEVEKTRKYPNQVSFWFVGKFKSVFEKLDLFKRQSPGYIEKELQKNGGKPPRGIVVIIHGKKLLKVDGKKKLVDAERATVSDFDFVVNLRNIIEFVEECFDKLINVEMSFDALSEDDSNGIFLIDEIKGLTIKFIR